MIPGNSLTIMGTTSVVLNNNFIVFKNLLYNETSQSDKKFRTSVSLTAHNYIHTAVSSDVCFIYIL